MLIVHKFLWEKKYIKSKKEVEADVQENPYEEFEYHKWENLDCDT